MGAYLFLFDCPLVHGERGPNLEYIKMVHLYLGIYKNEIKLLSDFQLVNLQSNKMIEAMYRMW